MFSPSKKTPSSRAPHGFSLPEVLVGVLLVGGVAFGIASFVATSMRLNKLALERTNATEVATQRLDLITSKVFSLEADGAEYLESYETDCSGGGCGTLPAGVDFWFQVAEPNQNDAWSQSVLPGYPQYWTDVYLTYDEPLTSMLTVKVVVYWRNLPQGTKSQTMIDFLHPDLERMQ